MLSEGKTMEEASHLVDLSSSLRWLARPIIYCAGHCAVQCSAHQYATTLPQVGDAHRWQLKIVLLLWIPMFMCGTQFITTDFMTHEPKILFYGPKECKTYIDKTGVQSVTYYRPLRNMYQ